MDLWIDPCAAVATVHLLWYVQCPASHPPPILHVMPQMHGAWVQHSQWPNMPDPPAVLHGVVQQQLHALHHASFPPSALVACRRAVCFARGSSSFLERASIHRVNEISVLVLLWPLSCLCRFLPHRTLLSPPDRYPLLRLRPGAVRVPAAHMYDRTSVVMLWCVAKRQRVHLPLAIHPSTCSN